MATSPKTKVKIAATNVEHFSPIGLYYIEKVSVQSVAEPVRYPTRRTFVLIRHFPPLLASESTIHHVG